MCNNNNRNKGAGRWFDEPNTSSISAEGVRVSDSTDGTVRTVGSDGSDGKVDASANTAHSGPDDSSPTSSNSVAGTTSEDASSVSSSVSAVRVRSVFPTTDESRRSMYRSTDKIFSPEMRETRGNDALTGTIEELGNRVTRSVMAGSNVETIADSSVERAERAAEDPVGSGMDGKVVVRTGIAMESVDSFLQVLDSISVDDSRASQAATSQGVGSGNAVLSNGVQGLESSVQGLESTVQGLVQGLTQDTAQPTRAEIDNESTGSDPTSRQRRRVMRSESDSWRALHCLASMLSLDWFI